MEEDFTPEDLAWINEPFTKKDLEYIESLPQIHLTWENKK